MGLAAKGWGLAGQLGEEDGFSGQCSQAVLALQCRGLAGCLKRLGATFRFAR